MGHIQMDAGISELRFSCSSLGADKKDIGRGDVRVPRVGGWWQAPAGYFTTAVFESVVLTDAVLGEGAVVLSSEISRGRMDYLFLSLSHGRVAVSGYQLRSTYVSLSLSVRKRALVYHSGIVVTGWSLGPFIRESGLLDCCDRLSLR